MNLKRFAVFLICVLAAGCTSINLKTSEDSAPTQNESIQTELIITSIPKPANEETISRNGETTGSAPSIVTLEPQTNGELAIKSTPDSIEPSKTCMLNKWHNVFFGIVGNDEICMNIYQDGNNIIAFCVYKESENELRLIGSLDGLKISLKDDIGNTLLGTLTSPDEIGKLIGKFIKSNGDEMPVSLEMEYACGADLDNFYEIMGSSDQEVEPFLIGLKNAIKSGNKQVFAEQIHYPINVSSNGERNTIYSQQEFIDDYDIIITSGLVDVISDAYTKFLFNNYQGVMFGGNQYNSTFA